MYTSLLVLALAGSVAPAAELSESPSWMRDYGAAVEKAHKEQKPLAVFFGSGAKGWDQLSTDGHLGRDAQRVLASRYVPLYLDTSKKAGQKLADAFAVKDGPALVISDVSGDNMALRYSGQLHPTDLQRALVKYADPERVVRATDTDPNQEVQYYAPADPVQPVQAVSPVFAPSFGGFGGFGGGGGGC